MITSVIKKKSYIFLFLIITLGIFFRGYNLSWGSPFFFHPDERNIANSITQLSYPNNLNPKFFAYGTLPIYFIYFTGVLINFIQNIFFQLHVKPMVVTFENAIIIGRSFSFFLSIAMLYTIYLVGKMIGGKKVGYISACLASLSVGLIQYSHFSTFEIWLSFFTIFLCYEMLCYSLNRNTKYLVYSSVLLGLLTSIKISSISFLPLCIFIILFLEIRSVDSHKSFFIKIERLLLKIVIFASIVIVTVYFTSPYFWFDNSDFISSIHYEISVAIGSLPVFYSQGFEKTIPLVYPLFKVYPFILNPIVLLFGFIASLVVIKKAFFEKNKFLLIVISFFMLAFVSQTFLYVKWIRYYLPTISFIYIFLGIYLSKVKSKIPLIILVIISLLYSFSYLKTVLAPTDSRVVASKWASKNIPSQSKLLSEVYDIGIITFNPYFKNINLFDFYSLDSDKNKTKELAQALRSAEYIVLPSQRILESRLSNPSVFPKGNIFYSNLLSGKLGFSKIYETPCDIFCYILYLGSPLYSYEQTANVFDRPTLLIFKHDKKIYN